MRLLTTIILCLILLHSHAQDTLPNFQVINSKGRIFVAYYNPYGSARQVNIERSHDSTRNFTTINALTDPRTGTVTFTDVAAPNDHMFYRIFIQLQGASYSFTPAKTPEILATPPPAVIQAEAAVSAPKRKPEWEPSTHIYTDDYGNVRVDFPLITGKKYVVRFFDDQQNFLFELPDVKERPLTIDKSNFLHAGWFNFVLYEDGVITERNKFLLSRDN